VNIKQCVSEKIEDSWGEQLNFLKELVRCRSTLFHEESVQELMAYKLKQLGLFVDVFEPDIHSLAAQPGFSPVEWGFQNRPQVVGVWNSAGAGEGGVRTLVLNGHADIVPVENSKLWTYNPWEPQIEGHRMYGRGTCDMKSGLASIVYAVSALKESGVELAGNVIVQSVIEEECSGNGTLACIAKGYKGTAALIAEPTDQSMLTAQTGVLWMRITVAGSASHVQSKGQSVNAIEKAYVIIQALKEIESEWNRNVPPSFKDVENPIYFNVGQISGGCWPSSVPDSCVLNVRIGIYPETEPEDMQRKLESQLKDRLGSDPWLCRHEPGITWYGHKTAGCLIDPAENTFYQIIENAHKGVTGRSITYFKQKACTDMRFFTLYHNMPATCYGASGGNEHGADEYVYLPSVLETTKVIASVILDYCGYVQNT
jgi:acetylornithine deacetylase